MLGLQIETADRQGSLRAKLKTDIDRFRDRSFLKAAMAVSALTALADGDVSFEERIASTPSWRASRCWRPSMRARRSRSSTIISTR